MSSCAVLRWNPKSLSGGLARLTKAAAKSGAFATANEKGAREGEAFVTSGPVHGQVPLDGSGVEFGVWKRRVD